jgi:N6-adenosine-specific RNA methylase IME4
MSADLGQSGGSSARFGTIVADPPWRYQKDVSMGAKPGAAESHYATMAIREIAALPVREIAADDAHLYLWVTIPRLYGDRGDRSFTPVDVMEAWGFEFKTMLTWVKPTVGLGWYFRGSVELVLFGVRGKAPIPAETRERNVIEAPSAGHSAKPDAFLDLVERVSPGPYAELFARRARFGWEYPIGDQALGGAAA